jgi:signal transduction histidine kinase
MVTLAPEQHLQILHLEDSLADQKLVQRVILRSYPDAVVTPVDSLESFETLITSRSFDIILADYRLNGFTALDAWQHVAQLHQPPPFVLVSGAVGEAAAVDALHLGIADYLLKDDIARLPHVVARAIEVHQAKKERELAVAELADSQKRLSALTEHLQTSIEQERAAIAREIHDDIGGALTAVRFDIAWIGRHATTDAMKEHATAASDMLQHAVGASQRIMMNLRPPVLEQGLAAAVKWLASSFERRTEISTHVHLSREDIHVSPEIQLVAYRTAQEALTNIGKYAQPSKVSLDLSDDEGVLTLEIADNGCGMTPEMRTKPKAFGLKGLQERARTVGGWLDISSQPSKGTCITLTVPLTSSPTKYQEGEVRDD